MPVEAQFAPIFGFVIQDFNEDGNLDVLLAGNDYSIELMSGRIDASTGLVLIANGDGTFKSLKPHQSGFEVSGDVKGLSSLVNAKGQQLIVATQNKDDIETHIYAAEKLKTLDPKQATGAILHLDNGKTRKHEIYHGSSFLSQSSKKILLDKSIKKVTLNINGKTEVIDID